MLSPFYQNKLIEAGCDEAGRGCFAGPVFAAAVILPKKINHKFLIDSKQLNEKQRNEMRKFIENEAVSYFVSSISNEEIDNTNILKASLRAMHISIAHLNPQPELLLIDGNYFVPFKKIPHRCIIKGDGIYTSIAAASILAKTYRDEYMMQLHKEFPHFHWSSNKGYGTEKHRKAIEEFGICKYHRKSFKLMPKNLFNRPNFISS